MNKLALNINIFKDEMIVNFLRQDFEAPHIKQLKDQYDSQLREIIDANECLQSYSGSNNTSYV